MANLAVEGKFVGYYNSKIGRRLSQKISYLIKDSKIIKVVLQVNR